MSSYIYIGTVDTVENDVDDGSIVVFPNHQKFEKLPH